MQWMRRAIGILPPLVLVLAACAAPGTGGGDTNGGTGSLEPMASGSPAASDDGAAGIGRVDIGDVFADPSSFAGQELTVLGRVDAVLINGTAFLTSPSAEPDGLLVILADDATVEKDVAEKRVLWITGTVVPFTSEDLASAGASVSTDDASLADYTGEYVLVATQIGDPLASGE